jgi:hypothetical protein
MSKQVLHTAKFSDAAELVDAINYLLSCVDGEIVYISCDKGFMHTGAVFLIEKTLTDGSKAYDMEIGEQP